jgi:hypothetical protein
MAKTLTFAPNKPNAWLLLLAWVFLIVFFVEMDNFIETGPTMVWVSWVIPLFITEILLQWNKE